MEWWAKMRDFILLREEHQARTSGGPRKVYVIKCIEEGCNKEVKVRAAISELTKSTLKCKTHSHIKRPFESIYNGLFNDHRSPDVQITYEDFLKFTEIKQCHYCLEDINWQKYSVVDGKYLSRAYFLDRKDNKIGYTKDNLVVCCTRCNRARGDKFSYDDWFGMTEYLRNKIQK